ncbi:MAG: transcriptional regulator [Bacteroidetes bacterium]|nr:transcriptional regulator [Bacteroidota bacterium]
MEISILEEKINYANSENCPVRLVVDRIGQKWSVLILMFLKENKVMRYGQIHKRIGDISHKMLSQTLRSLEVDGLIFRKVYPVAPPKVEYGLKLMGEELYPLVRDLTAWANVNLESIFENRRTFLEE